MSAAAAAMGRRRRQQEPWSNRASRQYSYPSPNCLHCAASVRRRRRRRESATRNAPRALDRCSSSSSPPPPPLPRRRLRPLAAAASAPATALAASIWRRCPELLARHSLARQAPAAPSEALRGRAAGQPRGPPGRPCRSAVKPLGSRRHGLAN